MPRPYGEEEFYEAFTALLRRLTNGRELADPRPDTHLWVEGYLDSLALLEVIAFLEDLSGRAIDLDGALLPNLFTMESMFRAYLQESSPS